MDAHEYVVNVDWKADRLGVLSSIELPAEINIEVATPPQFPKGIPNVWSPEHLFTAAVVSCFMTTFLSIAENSKLDFSKFSCSAKGKLEQVEGKLKMTSVRLQPSICIADTAQKEKVARVMQKAEAACLISNSITASVQLNPTLYV
jgi:peroxiredoxin-like protein